MTTSRSTLRRSALLLCVLAVGMAACGETPDPLAPDGLLSAKGGVKGKPGGNDQGPGTPPNREDFDVWDETRWEKGDHPLGRGWFLPDNVDVQEGRLTLTLPANTFNGGEIKSVERFRGGVYEASIKAAAAPGSLTAFFLYEYTDRKIDEIDIEIIPDFRGDGPIVMLTTWLRDVETNHERVRLDFDPTADFHTYRIEAGRKAVRFYIDDQLMAEFTQGIPTARMHLMMSAWWPTWLTGEQPESDAMAEVDWIRF